MKNLDILVPIDFSDLSYHAFGAAETMASYFDGTITPFHAYIPLTDIDGSYYMGLGVAAQTTMTDLEPVLKDRLNQVANDHVEKKYLKEAELGIGNPAHAIIETAEDYDMIVMSTHGRTGFSRLLLGSVTEKILRLSHKPTLVVEEESNMTPLKKILVTSDLSKNSEAAFPYAEQIAKASGAELELIHIVKFDDFNNMADAQESANMSRQRLDNLKDQHFSEIKDQVKTEVIISSESAHEAIYNLDQSRKYNMIIMSTIGRTGLRYLTMGSTTANVVRLVNTAILSINPPQLKDKNMENEEAAG